MVASLVITVFIIGVRTRKTIMGEHFEIWFTEVKRLAPYFGYSPLTIKDFRKEEWMNYWGAGLSPEEAIKFKLSE